MEHLIAKLLQNFEQGKMTGLQLIQSLALAATAASAASAVPTAAADGKGFKAITVNHISYQVADYAKTRDFYADLLGMKVSQDDGKQCFLSFGDTFMPEWLVVGGAVLVCVAILGVYLRRYLRRATGGQW
jgi:hypothetical protein